MVLGVLISPFTVGAAEAPRDPILVKYRSAETIYLAAGSAVGLGVGDRLSVQRGEVPIAELEVVFVAEYSASARILTERLAVEVGDQAVPAARITEEVLISPPQERTSESSTVPREMPVASQSGPAIVLETPRPSPVRAEEFSYTPRLSGSIGLELEDFSDQDADLSFQQSTVRLNLRSRNIGGSPYSFRARLRTQETQRSESLGDLNASRDRFYELSLSYEPEDHPFGFRAGRIATTPVLTSTYLDGVLGWYSPLEKFEFGGFFGSRADVEQLGFESVGQAYGLFTRFSNRASASPRQWETVLAGTREDGMLGVSREFVSLQSSLRMGRRFFLFQRADVDLNRGWRKELAGSSSQLSNLSLAATAQFSETVRLTLSYDLFEQYRTEETRSIPEQLFTDSQRQGLRAILAFGKPRGLNVSVRAGTRQQEGQSDSSTSFGLGVGHPNVRSWGLSLRADTLVFSNEFSDGSVTTLTASKRFASGHQGSLTLGDRSSKNVVFDASESLSTQWLRLGGWFELPKDLFANLEYELTAGDEFEGQRLTLALGYRF